MAISDTQKVDYLFKKIGAGAAKTDVATSKSPSNEAVASPLKLRGDIIWQQAGSIPATQPASTTGVVTVYSDANTNTIQCTADATSATSRTWLTNLGDWIPPEFGATYQVKAYLATTGNTAPQTYGVQLSADGAGTSDEWFFDYEAGVLNFAGTNLPSQTFTGKSIFIVGARYTGQKGLSNFVTSTKFGNIQLANNTVSITNTNGNLFLQANGTGIISLGNTTTVSGNVTASNVAATQFTGNIVGTTGFITGNIATGYITVGAGSSNRDAGLLGQVTDSLGFTTQNGNGIILANEQGVVEQYLFLGDTDTTSTGTLLGVSVYDGSTTKVALNLTGTGNLTVANVNAWFNGNVNTNFITGGTSGNLNITPGSTFMTVLNSTTALVVPQGSTAQQPTGTKGAFRYNTDTNAPEYYNGSAWVSLLNQIYSQTITPSGSTATFNLDKSTTTNGVIVSVNGTLQAPSTAYTVTGNQITFTETPLVDDIIEVRFITNATTLEENIVQVSAANIAVGTTTTIIDSFSRGVYRGGKYTITSTAANGRSEEHTSELQSH